MTDIQSGMFLDFTYSKDGETKRYIGLVIDPDKKHPTTSKAQLHALLVDGMSDAEILRLVASVGNITFDPDNKKSPITFLKTEDAYDKYKASSILTNRKYRTFLVNNMSSVRQILIGAPS